MRLLFVLGSLMLFLTPAVLTVQAQETRQPEGTVRVVLVDGTVVVGTIVRETDDEVEVLTQAGVRTTIPRGQIRSITSIAGQRFSRLDPNRTRLFFAPTARPIERGTGYVADYELFFPYVAYGATSRLALAGGVSIIPGIPFQMVYVAPKLTLVNEASYSVAAGVLANAVVGDVGDEDVPLFGLLYAVGTYGRPEAAVTGGVGLGYAEGEVAQHPVLMLGGEIQVSNSIKFLSENYVIVGVEDGLVLSAGVRFFGDRLSADFGLITNPALIEDADGLFAFPWLGFAYVFGTAR